MAAYTSAAWLFTFVIALLNSLTYATAVPQSLRPRNGVPSRVGGLISMGSGTYPRAVILQDESILGSYTTSSDGNSSIQIVRSTDQGETWSPVGIVYTRPTIGADLDNGFVLQLSTGRVLCAFRNHDKSGDDYVKYRITIAASDDGGASWALLSEIDRDGPTFHGLWEPFLRLAQDGSIQMYYTRENEAANQVNLMQPSFDGGATWASEVPVSSAPRVRDGMIGVASLGGSSLLAVFEAIPFVAPPVSTLVSATSHDDGATWGDRRLIYQAPCDGVCGAGAPQLINVGGTLVVTFMTDEDDPGKPWFKGVGVKTITSVDSGETWTNKVTITPPFSLWPGLLALDNSTFLNFVSADGVQIQRMVIS